MTILFVMVTELLHSELLLIESECTRRKKTTTENRPRVQYSFACISTNIDRMWTSLGNCG